MSLGALIFSLAFYMPSFLQNSLTMLPNGLLKIIPAEFSKASSYQVLYSVALFYLFSYILPILSLVTMGSLLVRNLRMTKVSLDNTAKIREEMTLSLVVIVVVFVICQTMGPVRRILMLVFVPYRSAVQCRGQLFYYGPWVLNSILINSSANFIIYVLFARAFRRKVKKLIERASTKIAPENAKQKTTHFATALDQSKQGPSSGI
jgi:hypothetical protein